jgi:hypothetical protein
MNLWEDEFSSIVCSKEIFMMYDLISFLLKLQIQISIGLVSMEYDDMKSNSL